MKLLYKLERRLGRYAIRDLMKYIVALFALGLFVGTIAPMAYYYFLSLDFSAIMRGQVWRIITFIIPVSSMSGIIWTAISAYFYYIIGVSLERAWGAFRLNLYFFSGILFNIISYWITFALNGNAVFGSPLSLICQTMFFAFAAIYPETQFYIYFLIPVKAKYLAWISGAIYIFNIVTDIMGGRYLAIIPIIVSLANFLIFFFVTRNYKSISPREFQRKATFKRKMQEAKMQGNVVQMNGRNVITRHKCAVCGRTELDNDQLEFRFCSKCDGNYEYCMDHLFTHEHVKR